MYFETIASMVAIMCVIKTDIFSATKQSALTVVPPSTSIVLKVEGAALLSARAGGQSTIGV